MVGNLVRRCEQTNNKGMEQTNPRLRRASARLAFADHMDRLVACDRTPGSPKRSEMLTRVDSSLDRPVVLFQDVIQVRQWPVPTVLVQSAFSWLDSDGILQLLIREIVLGVFRVSGRGSPRKGDL